MSKTKSKKPGRVDHILDPDQRPFYTPHNSPDEETLPGNNDTAPSERAGNLSFLDTRPSHFKRKLNVDAKRHEPLLQGEGSNTQEQSMSPDWHQDQASRREFFDDGTMTYFWLVHCVSCLLFII